MERRYSFICDYATTDKNGKMIIIGIFEKMTPRAFPYTHPSFFYIVSVKLEDAERGEHLFSVEILDNNDVKVSTINGAFSVKKDQPYGDYNFMLNFNNITFKDPSLYKIILKVENNVLATDYINAIKAD
jgi:hypothetical protein